MKTRKFKVDIFFKNFEAIRKKEIDKKRKFKVDIYYNI